MRRRELRHLRTALKQRYLDKNKPTPFQSRFVFVTNLLAADFVVLSVTEKTPAGLAGFHFGALGAELPRAA
jgi:hypothetical protein